MILISKHKCVKQSFSDILREKSESDSSSQFIVALVVTQHILSYTRPPSQALQKADWDVVKACIDANTCKKVTREQREDKYFS